MEDNFFISYQSSDYSVAQTENKATEYRSLIESRRSIRAFSDKPVPKQVIENIIMTAASAPSGAHKQPWTFCAISNQAVKHKIRKAAEEEEFANYNGRMSDEWLEDLKKFATNHIKEFLTMAPWLIVIFKKSFDQIGNQKSKNYYVNESVGIAAGFLITAIHNAGLVTLTHTPSPMNFLQQILDRPANEKPFLLLPVGYPALEAQVPILTRKSSDEVIKYFE